jgi:hypothetical protein
MLFESAAGMALAMPMGTIVSMAAFTAVSIRPGAGGGVCSLF